MAESLLQVAKLCPTVRRVILLGPPVEGAISFQQMVQDSGDMFNENLDVRWRYIFYDENLVPWISSMAWSFSRLIFTKTSSFYLILAAQPVGFIAFLLSNYNRSNYSSLIIFRNAKKRDVDPFERRRQRVAEFAPGKPHQSNRYRFHSDKN